MDQEIKRLISETTSDSMDVATDSDQNNKLSSVDEVISTLTEGLNKRSSKESKQDTPSQPSLNFWNPHNNFSAKNRGSENRT